MKNTAKTSELWINYWEQCIVSNTEATTPLLWQLEGLLWQNRERAFSQPVWGCRANIQLVNTSEFEEQDCSIRLTFHHRFAKHRIASREDKVSVPQLGLNAREHRYSACLDELHSFSHMNLSSSINISTFGLPASHLRREQQKHTSFLWLPATQRPHMTKELGRWQAMQYRK